MVDGSKEIIKSKKLQTPWAMWETYELKPKEKFSDNMSLLYEFKYYEEFIDFFAFLPHGEPSKLFSFDNEVRKYLIEDKKEYKKIDSLCLFREKIRPEWEDPRNYHKSSILYALNDITKDNINLLWSNLACSVIGETLKNSKYINGVRIVDKVKNNTKRIEVWLSEDVTKDIGLEKSVRSEIIDIFEISNISENKIAKSFVSFHSAN